MDSDHPAHDHKNMTHVINCVLYVYRQADNLLYLYSDHYFKLRVSG